MHLVRASYVPKQRLPFPSAGCLSCLCTVCCTRGSSEQHQVTVRTVTGSCCPCRGSWPPSDLLPNKCMLLRRPGGVLMSFHGLLPCNHRFISAITMQISALPGARMAVAPKGILDCSIHSKGKQGGTRNGALHWEGSRTRRRPRY